MIRTIFSIVALSLDKIAQLLHLTYTEINIIVYYFLIPLSWTIILDVWIGLPIITLIFLCIWVGIYAATHKFFKKWCDWMFEDSVKILNYFNRWGGNYILNSVNICVILPIVIYIVLLYCL